MMNYAVMTNKVFSTRGEVKMKKKMSPEAAARKKYIEGHTFEFHVNPVTKEASVDVRKKDGK